MEIRPGKPAVRCPPLAGAPRLSNVCVTQPRQVTLLSSVLTIFSREDVQERATGSPPTVWGRSRLGEPRWQGARMANPKVVQHYEVRCKFEAPLPFVYRWCTDYEPTDGRTSGEGYARRILRRSSRRVVLEDLYDTKKGWIWIHRDVRLSPPDRWHADSVGSDRALSVDYRLSDLSEHSTLMTIHARRWTYGIGTSNPPKRSWEGSVQASWTKYGRALERDYREGRFRQRIASVSPKGR